MIDPEDQHPTSFIQHAAESEHQKDPGRLIFGRYLATVDAPRQTISKVIGLTVFASDALSSSAYAIDEEHGMPLHQNAGIMPCTCGPQKCCEMSYY